MTAMPFSFPIFKAFTTTGTLGPLAGGLLHTFEAGTSTPLAVWQDDALTVPHTNPVVLDSNGQATIYLGPNAYKMRLEDSTGAVQPGWPIDGIQKDIDILRADLAATTGAGMVGFDATASYPAGTIGNPVAGLVQGTQLMGPTNQRVLQSNAQSYGPFISRPWCTTQDLSIFVDPATGSDSNPGTLTDPLQTVEAACQLIPQNIYHKIRIYLLDGDYSGQTITLFNYFITASSNAGLKIIGHVASVGGEAHPVYASDDLNAVTIDGSHVISGCSGTEELTIAGVKFVNSWVECYSSLVLLDRCKFDGGYTVPGFEARICLGGHIGTIRCYACDFTNCAAAVDATEYLNVFFDNCTISAMIDSPYYPGTYGMPIRSTYGSVVFIRSSATFYSAGVAGKKNVTSAGGMIFGGFPYSDSGSTNYIRRDDSSENDALNLDGGTGTAPAQARGAHLALYGKNASGNNGKAILDFGPSVAATFKVRYVPVGLTPLDCVTWDNVGNTTLNGGGWNTPHLVLGAYHLWVDATGDLRIKSTAPTSDLDGTIVGTQS